MSDVVSCPVCGDDFELKHNGIAKIFGVSNTTIKDIRLGRRWINVI